MNGARVLLPLLAAFAIAAGGCGSGSGSHTSQAPAQIAQLQSIAQLRHTFDAHPGVPRLILLISPT